MQPVALVAQDIVKRSESLGDVSATVLGGFVNVAPKAELINQSLADALDPTYGESSIGNGQPVVVELSSPNIAKPMDTQLDTIKKAK